MTQHFLLQPGRIADGLVRSKAARRGEAAPNGGDPLLRQHRLPRTLGVAPWSILEIASRHEPPPQNRPDLRLPQMGVPRVLLKPDLQGLGKIGVAHACILASP